MTIPRKEENNLFRSVLPHEALPIEERGYLHLQGAFCPRMNKKKVANSSVNLDGQVDSDQINGSQDDDDDHASSVSEKKMKTRRVMMKFFRFGREKHFALL